MEHTLRAVNDGREILPADLCFDGIEPFVGRHGKKEISVGDALPLRVSVHRVEILGLAVTGVASGYMSG